MLISDWSSDVCSSDLAPRCAAPGERSEVRVCNGGPCSIPSKGESGLAARLGKAGAIACRVTVAAHGGPLPMPGTVIGKPTILDPDDERPCLILGARSVKLDRPMLGPAVLLEQLPTRTDANNRSPVSRPGTAHFPPTLAG